VDAADVELWLVRLHGDALVTAQNAGVIDTIGEGRILPTVRSIGRVRHEWGTDSDGHEPSDTDDVT